MVVMVEFRDKKLKFFSNSMKGHYSRDKILSIHDENGMCFTDATEVKDTIVSYFEKLLGVCNSDFVLDSSILSKALPQRLSLSQSMILDNSITDEEIQKILFSLKDNKALSLNGFSVGFFKKAWSIVGSDTINSIRTFFILGRLLKQVNAITISLIPKVPNSSKVKDFRPISCCNTIYKCIAKLIANRIKGVLPNLVRPFQSTFFVGRNISDNI
jgi:hypothetical protein